MFIKAMAESGAVAVTAPEAASVASASGTAGGLMSTIFMMGIMIAAVVGGVIICRNGYKAATTDDAEERARSRKKFRNGCIGCGTVIGVVIVLSFVLTIIVNTPNR